MNSITGGKAEITIKEINEEIPEGEGVSKTQGEITDDGSEKIADEKNYSWFYWIVGIIIVLIVVWFVIQKKKK